MSKFWHGPRAKLGLIFEFFRRLNEKLNVRGSSRQLKNQSGAQPCIPAVNKFRRSARL